MSLQFNPNERAFTPDLNNIARISSNAVRTGCEVTESGPAAMSVDVASGSILFGTTIVAVTGTTLAIAASHASLDRIDLVLVDSSGTLSVVTGTPAADPTTPAYDPDTHYCLARVFVDDLVTSILDARITDLRIINTGTGQFGKFEHAYTASTSEVISHNLDDPKPQVQVFDDSSPPKLIVPKNVEINNPNTVTVTFDETATGTIIIHGGVGLTISSTPPSGNTFIFSQASPSTTWNITHNLGQTPVLIQTYDSSDILIIPQSITLNTNNTATLVFTSAEAGKAIVKK